ncbi:MAG: SUMF1/EgtB/PvdO family nonheme iron enzyme [Acidobacteriota bacterium]|nr:SUMF1/EgtB/PvdO family nonheme iron enzyme [Acidobacteriota bacterium]
MTSTEPSCFITQLIHDLQEARARTLELVADLSNEQMIGPRLAIVNPLCWEIAHVAWFQEYWVLRHLRQLDPVLTHGDSLYNSAHVAHDTRGNLPLPSKAETIDYMQRILDRVLEQTKAAAARDANGYDEAYFLRLALFHEDMHAEAITYTRQTLGYAAPRLTIAQNDLYADGHDRSEKTNPASYSSLEKLEDAEIPGGIFLLGSTSDMPFVFDNEMWAHPVKVKPFAIAQTAVTNAEFASFVDDGGYRRAEFWDEKGWQWRKQVGAEHPVYWQQLFGGSWLRRNFDQWMPLEEYHPVLHVNWHEASAYCRWAGRRLPTEAEWEMAACAETKPAKLDERRITESKRLYPWGDEPPTPERANLDWRNMGCIDARALSEGESAFGCRQMIGNTWEWTASAFAPFPGFASGPYKEYSAPWFGDHKVLRGGCWATRSRLIRNYYRNFYQPERRDVWAGFRTCAL